MKKSFSPIYGPRWGIRDMDGPVTATEAGMTFAESLTEELQMQSNGKYCHVVLNLHWGMFLLFYHNSPHHRSLNCRTCSHSTEAQRSAAGVDVHGFHFPWTDTAQSHCRCTINCFSTWIMGVYVYRTVPSMLTTKHDGDFKLQQTTSRWETLVLIRNVWRVLNVTVHTYDAHYQHLFASSGACGHKQTQISDFHRENTQCLDLRGLW